MIIHGIERILLGHNFFDSDFFFIEKSDMTQPNKVIFKFPAIYGRVAKFIPLWVWLVVLVAFKQITAGMRVWNPLLNFQLDVRAWS